MARYSQQDGSALLLPSDYRAPSPSGGGGESSGMDWLSSLIGADRSERVSRKAADVFQRPLRSMGLVQEANPSRLRMGRVLPGIAALSAVSALGNLADSNDPLGRNVAQMGGEVAGGIGLSSLAALIPAPPPLKLALMALASAGGGQLGKSVTGGLYDMANDPQSKALKDYEAQQAAVTRAKVNELQALLPVQSEAAALQLRNREKQLEQDSTQRMNDAMVAAMLRQQDANKLLAAQITDGILGGSSLV